MSTIVVGVDGSRASAAALDWAAAEAALRGDELLVLYGIFVPISTIPFSETTVLPASEHARDIAQQVLTAATTRVSKTAPDVPVEPTLVEREPADALIEASADADLIVVGTRGLGGFKALTLGSVSSRVAAGARCPVIVVPEADDDQPPGGTVVVGVDDSPLGPVALRFAIEHAARHSLPVEAVYVYDLPLYERPVLEVPELSPEMVTTFQDRGRERASKFIQITVDRALADTGRTVDVTAVAVEGDPADTLVARSNGAVLTVVGSRGRGPLRGLLLGSVSQSLLPRTDRPVAVVHAPQDVSEDGPAD